MYKLTVCNLFVLCIAPEAPRNFTILDVTNTSVELSWDPPSDPNGIISNYTVLLVLHSTDTSIDSVVLPASMTESVFDGLDSFVNYTAIVFASTSFGAGSRSSVNFMTESGSKFSTYMFVSASA